MHLFWQVNTLLNHHLYQDVEHFRIKSPQWHFAVNPTVDNPWSELYHFMLVLPAVRFHINGIVQQVLFCACLLSLSIFLRWYRLFHVFIFVCFITEYYFIVWIHCPLFIIHLCGHWVVYNFCLWWIKPLRMSAYKHFSGHVFILKEWETNTYKCNC